MGGQREEKTQISVWVPTSLIKDLDHWANKNRIRRSEAVREAIIHMLMTK